MVTSSRVSLQPAQFWTCYATSKSALNYFISCIPLETSNVRCVAMTPGLVDTPLLGNAIHDGKLIIITRGLISLIYLSLKY